MRRNPPDSFDIQAAALDLTLHTDEKPNSSFGASFVQLTDYGNALSRLP